VQVIANALDPYWPLPAAAARAEDGYVLAVARLAPEHAYKGVDRVIDALARIGSVRLVVAGDGPDRARLEARATAAGIDARFSGLVSDAALAELYRGARAFVLPSTGEGFGLVYLEAMAFGLPCVAARAGGAPEVVDDGVTGVVVEPDDDEGLRTAIARVLGDEGAALGAAGRARVERHFSYAAYEQRVHAALDALAEGSQRRSRAMARQRR
jgi:glycosyltransferase involved in cell wall biosynthesis